MDICTEHFGDSVNPPILLIMGATASMVWWDAEFCKQLANRGFYVIRYDNRDTGQSTTFPAGESHYATLDLAEDVLAVMDAYQLQKAHLVGMSLGGMLAQLVTIQHPERVNTITMIASGIWDDKSELPGIDPDVLAYHASAGDLDWEDEEKVIDYMVGGWRILNGSRHPFDEKRTIQLARAELKRANNLLSMFNHSYLKGGEELYGRSAEIKAPALIIHGTEDKVLPFQHALELQKTIPNATLLEIKGAGHEIHPLDWDLIIEAIAEHAKAIRY
ncbi:MAG TPA: alpha/beta fold hydrolase [Prolixibacteraceae bacterium]|nr:alpha/beta fold hydrolase [Prolixibacteraceae bacterium]